jgi:hypothetical protein
MRLLSKIVSIALVIWWVQFICDSVVSQTGDLYGNRSVSSVAQSSFPTSVNTAPNRQLQYYQNQYVREPSDSRSEFKPTQPMGGYPNNLADVNSNPNSSNNGVGVGSTYVAANPLSRSMLPTNHAVGLANGATESSKVDSDAGKAVGGLPNNVYSPSTIPKSNEVLFGRNSVAGVGINSPLANRVAANANSGGNGVGSSGVNGEVKVDSSRVSLPNNLPVSDSGAIVGGVSEIGSDKPNSRLKPTESMQDVMSSPQKIKSLIPSFLLRKRIDDPFGEDDGLEMVDKVRQNGVTTEQMYIDFATKSKSVVSKEMFIRAIREEEAGNFSLAADLFKEFIKLNSRRTVGGTLAVPYHRLALIAWNRQNAINEADVYFKYALRYAKDGVVPIIVSDYNRFLTEGGRLDQAEAVLRNAISVFPHEQQLKVELGRCLAMQDRAVEALRHIRPVLGGARAYLELAAIYRGRGDYEMSEVLMQRRDEFIAKSNGNDRIIAGVSAGIVGSDYLRNNNSTGQSNNLTKNYSGVGGQNGIPFSMVANNASSGVGKLDISGDGGGNVTGVGYTSSELPPVDTFNVAVSAEEYVGAGLGNGGSVDTVLNRTVNRSSNPPNNAVVQPTQTDQTRSQPESIISPTYKIKGYHYPAENVAPIFLQH